MENRLSDYIENGWRRCFHKSQQPLEIKMGIVKCPATKLACQIFYGTILIVGKRVSLNGRNTNMENVRADITVIIGKEVYLVRHKLGA